MAEKRVQRRLAAILAADVVGYSRLIEADEAGTVARLKSLMDEMIRPRVTDDGGKPSLDALVGHGSLLDARWERNSMRGRRESP